MSAADEMRGQGRTLSCDELVSLLTNIFQKHGASSQVAAILAETCAYAERDGAKSHGIFRIPGYVASLKSGYVDGSAVPTVHAAATAFLQVDANNGFAQPALAAAKQPLMEAASKAGIAIAAIRNSHHFGALWLDVEPFAEAGFIAITSVNSVARMVPYGGNRPVFGTNPIAFAAPREGAPPLVLDQATSSMAFGEVRLAAMHGESLAEGCAVDQNGMPTTDASKVVDGGSLLPFGGYKGSSIAMMVELLSGVLTGGALSTEVDTSGFPGAQTSRTGQVVILIDSTKVPNGSFANRTAQLCRNILGAGQERLPGDRRYKNRAEADRKGIVIEETAYQAMIKFQ